MSTFEEAQYEYDNRLPDDDDIPDEDLLEEAGSDDWDDDWDDSWDDEYDDDWEEEEEE